MNAIDAKAISKSFEGKKVLHDIELGVAPGEIFGFVGPNAAGKTTFISILTGQRLPDQGSVHLLGRPMGIQAADLKRRLGVVPTEPQLFEVFTTQEYLDALGAMYGVPPTTAPGRISELLAFFDLESARHQVVASHSFGMRKKLAMAGALLHSPEVLFLDEPFEGMDGAAIEATADLLQTLAAGGTTIFMSSHRLELVTRICTSAAILHSGRIVHQAQGSGLADLEARYLECTALNSRSLSWLPQGTTP